MDFIFVETFLLTVWDDALSRLLQLKKAPARGLDLGPQLHVRRVR